MASNLATVTVHIDSDNPDVTARITEFLRLDTALSRLQALPNNVTIFPLSNRFVVRIFDKDYLTVAMLEVEGETLLAACEAALTQYDHDTATSR